MRNKAINANNHSFSSKDEILVDANIWIDLYGPAANPNRWSVRTYSNIYARMLTAGCKLFLDLLILSEFVNRFARIEMRRIQPTQGNFKSFRQSTDFPPVARAIETQVTQILSVCNPIDHPFAEWPHIDLMKDFSTGSVDLNDQLLAHNCRKHGLAILTNDSDFTEGGISVFTANNRLLTACP
jgi:predicted nucleic acid-binding protein